jgi:uncharacterized protein (TIGR03083 family)
MTRLSYDRLCDEIVAQTDLLGSAVDGADLTVRVPSCPDWSLGQLLRHLGAGHRYAETIVRTRAASPPPDVALRNPSEKEDEDPAVLADWLAEGAERLADTLRAAGPGARMWTAVSGETAAFWARRFAHETVMHRADASLAAGADFTVDREVALDALDEWMELGSLPEMFEYHPRQRELLGPGRTIHLHATDAPPEAAAEWLVDLTGDVIAWRPAHEPAAVAVRAPVTSLLLLVYRRRPAHGDGIEVVGDSGLLDFWLDRVAFG